ncbi:MAG: T9SS type A sorting domain-containing protein [Calditrichaeota bacterium]|nr:T9SS type A sorting domain-containing protein [Calditrichota bacterium]
MKNFSVVFLTCLLAHMISCSLAFSQDFRSWEPADGIAVRQGHHVEWFRSGAYRLDGELPGEAGITWSDCRNGDRGVFIQVMDAEGEAKFPENGLQVVDGDNRQEEPVIAACSDGGWFVAWVEFRSDTLGNIYCTKVNAEGEMLWGEENIGLPIGSAPSVQEAPVIVEDADGGCIVAWRDHRHRGDAGDIYAMHVLSDGRIDPDWTENGVAVVSVPGAQVNHEAVSDGDGGMIISWKDGRLGGDFNVWAQRISPQGELLWGEGSQVCNHEASQETPRLCTDGNGGAFIVWVDNRNANESNQDIYIQRISHNGESHWGEPGEGIPLCTVEEEQTNPRIFNSEPGSAIVIWEDRRLDGAHVDIYAMRVSGEDDMFFEWEPEDGLAVIIDEFDQFQPGICPDGNGGFKVVWQAESENGFPEIDIRAQWFNAEGERLWGESGVVVSDAPGLQSLPVVLPNSDGHTLLIWSDFRTGGNEIRGQRLNENGESLWDEAGVIVVLGMSQNALNHIMLSRGNGDLAIVWLDGRFSSNGQFPYIQICCNGENNPEIQLPTNGIPLLSPEINGGVLSIQAEQSSDDAIIVVWEDHRRGQSYSTYAQKISWEGEILWGEEGVKCADMAFDQERPFICSDGAGGAIIAYRYPTNDEDFDIYMQRLDEAGNRLWDDEGFLLTSNNIDDSVESLTPDGEGGTMVLWRTSIRDGSRNLWIQRVNENHELLWGENRLVSNEAGNRRECAIARHEEGYVVVWRDEQVDDFYILGQFINNDGSFRWDQFPSGYMICTNDFYPGRPTVSVGADNNIWVAWEDFRNFEGTDLYMQKLSSQANNRGEPDILFRVDDEPIDNGIPVCRSAGDQRLPAITTDGNNGIWLVWEDYRGGVWSDIYGTHLTTDGVPFDGWSENGLLVCGATHRQQIPKAALINDSGDEGIAVVWEDKRATGMEELSNIFIQALDDGMVSVPDQVVIQPTGFILQNPFPNPFNSTSTINYTLFHMGLINLTIYDLHGREVMTLLDGTQDRGSYTLPISADKLNSGLYIVRLTTGNRTATRKLAVVK